MTEQTNDPLHDPRERSGFFNRLRAQINRGDSFLTYDLANFLPGRGVEDDLLEDLETRLIMADVGVEATDEVMTELQSGIHHGLIKNGKDLVQSLRAALHKILQPSSAPLEIPEHTRPYVILMVGVNGVGKTTTIGKLAQRFKREGKNVMLAAGDTFRAAAVEQLKTWGERNDVTVISQQQGSDSASVIYDAVEAAKARGVDVLIADTAGRLHTQSHLIDELRKIKRVIQRLDAYAPHEVMLVVDATTGSNALTQAQQFHEAVGLTGLTITKLDGSAKGGIVFALAKKMAIPIRFIGVGETVDDLGVFDAREFVDATLETS